MLRCYTSKKFGAAALRTLGQIAGLIDEYDQRGFALTVRQIHYQFVSRGWAPNTAATYSRLQGLISEGRLAGLLSWTAIEDRNRSLMGHRTYVSPAEAVRAARAEYKIDMWANQEWRPEVWVEKAALEGVVGQIASRLRVDYYACRGYNSQSEQWRAGRRFARRVQEGQRPIVFHLGDHDPSGLDMTRDNRERLSLFAGVPVLVQRLALNMDQVEQYSPPPNYAKPTDSRYEAYQQQYGESSWELDALDPQVIQDLIRDAVDRVRDPVRWDAMLQQETEDLRQLDDVVEVLGGGNTTQEED